MANSDEQLFSILATLEECRLALRRSGRSDTAQLLSVAILDLRMNLNGIADSELKALCDERDELMPSDVSQERSRNEPSSAAPRRRPLLRVVKSS